MYFNFTPPQFLTIMKLPIQNLLLLLVIIFAVSQPSRAQKIVASAGEAQIEFPVNKSYNQVAKEAEQLAIINAIEKAFGRVVFQGNSTYIKNINSGKETETSTAFHMVGNTYVKGECLEVLSSEAKEVYDKKDPTKREVICKVKIKAREIVTPPIDFEAYPLSIEDKRAGVTDFKDGEQLYFYFYAPVDGYLNIFLDDNRNTYRLLPYSDMPRNYMGGMPVKADHEYILFSDKEIYNMVDEDPNYTEEPYVLVSDSESELNRFFILFSSEPLDKPFFRKELADEVLTDQEKANSTLLPDGTDSESFQQWLQKNRYIRGDIQLKFVDVTIRKK